MTARPPWPIVAECHGRAPSLVAQGHSCAQCDGSHAHQAGETGSSLRAAGWRIVAERPARKGWDTPSRPRTDRHQVEIPRTLWEAM